jgi:tetratricopeptide (TPR) repeat protein
MTEHAQENLTSAPTDSSRITATGAPPHALETGRKLFQYQVIGVYAQADVCIGYLCGDPDNSRLVTIVEYFPVRLIQRGNDLKLYPKSLYSIERFHQGQKHFIDITEALASLIHPHVEQVLDVFKANNTVYAVTDYQEGQSFDALLAHEKKLTEARLLEILYPLLDGIGKLLQRGFNHFSLTPASILIRKDGSPVLRSFHLISQGVEEGSEAISIESLIYQLGAILYRAVTGSSPPTEHERLEAYRQQGVDSHTPLLKQETQYYSRRMLKAIDLAMRLKPDKRPSSIEAWRKAFETDEDGDVQSEQIRVSQPPENRNLEIPPGGRISLNWERNLPSQPRLDSEQKTPWLSTRSFAVTVLALLALVGFYELTVKMTSLMEGDRTAPPAEETVAEEATVDAPPPTAVPGAPAVSTPEAEPPVESDRPAPSAIPITTTSLPEEQQSRIRTLLAEADKDFTEGRLTKPTGNNALEKYKTVFTIDISSDEAARGIARIALELIRLGEEATKRGEWDNAEAQLAKAASINPESIRLAEARQNLDKYRAEAQKQVSKPAPVQKEAEKSTKVSSKEFTERALQAMKRADWDAARKNLDQAAALDPANEDVNLLRDELVSLKSQAEIEAQAPKNAQPKKAVSETEPQPTSQPAGGTQVQIQRATSSQAKARPGETVEFFTEFSVSLPSGQKYEYVEATWALKRKGKRVGEEGVTMFFAKPGVNSVSNRLTLPTGIPPGQYIVEHRVEAGNGAAVATSSFSVVGR